MKFINTLKSIDPMMLAVAFTMNFVVAFMIGQHTRTAAKDASEGEVFYSDRYKALTLDNCRTDYECNIAQLLDDQANGRFVSTDDPIFFPDSVPVTEPIDCEPGDKECLKQNINAGKRAHYPAICEPYIFLN